MALANGRRLWATICEVQPGLFQAIYSNTGSASSERDLPAYETGLSVMDAKQKFEKDAQAFGYSVITWIDVNTADLALPRRSAVTYSTPARR